MICNFCKKNEVSVSVEQISDGVSKNIYLCKECAKRLGLGSFSENIDISITNLFKNQETLSQTKLENSIICPNCGTSLNDIKVKNQIGCTECVTIFKQEIMSILRTKKKNIFYMGKVPTKPAKEFTHRISIIELKQKLEKAIKDEEYELAAMLRDELKVLEKNNVCES